MENRAPDNDSTSSWSRWQWVTLVLLVLGYSGYYFCRSDLSVSTPLIIAELARNGISADHAKEQIGVIVSWGTLAYACGKFGSGAIADFLGGRRNFLIGMAGAVLFTVLFATTGTLPLFTLAWVGNRLIQSMGWVGMIKLTSRWFSYARYGAVMGIISISYLFGDAASRAFMGYLIAHGFGWRSVFMVAAATLGFLWAANFFLLKESPAAVGEKEPEASPTSVFGAEAARPKPQNIVTLLEPLLKSPAFWYVCLLSLGFTLVRETFNTWTPTYFTEAAHLKPADAATKSAFFPLLGGFSVLIAGFASDRLGSVGRALIILGGLLLTAGTLVLLALLDPGQMPMASVALVTLIAFVMIGPYSYLAGAMALDFGGMQGSATAAGIIDGVGYLAGVLAGDAMAHISVAFGWRGAFLTLTGVAGLSAIVALLYLRDQQSIRARAVPSLTLLAETTLDAAG